jgi:ammonia channel protein AmtB
MSALTVYLLSGKFKRSDIKANLNITVSNGVIAGLVMISAVCDDVSFYSALIIGIIAGITFLGGS